MYCVHFSGALIGLVLKIWFGNWTVSCFISDKSYLTLVHSLYTFLPVYMDLYYMAHAYITLMYTHIKVFAHIHTVLLRIKNYKKNVLSNVGMVYLYSL